MAADKDKEKRGYGKDLKEFITKEVPETTKNTKNAIKDALLGKDKGPRMTADQLRNQANVRPIQARGYVDSGVFPESVARRFNPDVDIRGTKGRLARSIKNKAEDDAKGGDNFPKIADSKMLDQVKRRLKKLKQGPGADENSKMVRSQAHDKKLKKNYREISKLEKIISLGTVKEKHNALNKAFKKETKDKKTAAPHLKRTSTYKFKKGGLAKKEEGVGSYKAGGPIMDRNYLKGK